MALTAKEIVDRVRQLKDERSNWESWWQDIAKFCIPRKAEITERKAAGTKFDADNYDSTARDSLKIFAAGLMGYLTNPATKWLNLRSSNPRLMQSQKVKMFFEESSNQILQTFSKSNFYQQLHEFYLDMPSFGTAAFYSEEDVQDRVRYYARNVREILFEEDDRGRVKTIYRVFELTIRQAYDRWGENAGKSVTERYAKKQYGTKVEYVQCVGPREKYDPTKRGKLNKPFHSIWVNVPDQKKVDEGGFEEMPFNVTRFTKVSHEIYGHSAAMDVFPDIKSTNKMMYYILRASAKAVDPPIVLPHKNYLLPFNFNPSGVNYQTQKTSSASEEKIQFLDHKGNFAVGRDILIDLREIIRRGFHVDLFLMLTDMKNMTATEVVERIQEKMLILGPVIGRLQTELLQPIVIRTFNILARNGYIPPIPQELENAEYEVEYVSVLAQAQKFSAVRTIQQFIAMIEQMAAIDPTVVDKFDSDKAADVIADTMGITPKIMREERELQAKREARAKQEEAAAKIALTKEGAEAAKTGAEAVATAAAA